MVKNVIRICGSRHRPVEGGRSVRVSLERGGERLLLLRVLRDTAENTTAQGTVPGCLSEAALLVLGSRVFLE